MSEHEAGVAKRAVSPPYAKEIQRIPRGDPSSPHRLSVAQDTIWLLDQLHPESALNHVAKRFRLRGSLDCAALERAFRMVAARHSILRTRLAVSDGIPTQSAGPAGAGDIEFRTAPLREEEVAQEARKPFDLSNGPMLRAIVFKRSESDQDLLIVTHRIVCDEWSVATLLRELEQTYAAALGGKAPTPPELFLEYADYAGRHRSRIDAELSAAAFEYWKRTLNGAPVLELPADRPRPGIRSVRGGQVAFAISPELTASFEAFLDRNNCSLLSGVLAIFQVMLHRYSGQDDICTGYTVGLRDLPETEPLLGPLWNTLVLRSDLSSNPTLGEFASQVEADLRTADEYKDLPFETVLDAVQPTRGITHTPLFQAMVSLEPQDWDSLSLSGLDATPVEIDCGASAFDLTLRVWKAGAALKGALEYNADLFDAATARRMATHFESLISAASIDDERRIGALPMLTPAETRQVLFEWNDTGRSCPPACIHELIAKQARRAPNRVAVTFGNRELTYAQVDGRANALAHRLRALGVGPGSLVGVCVERSAEMVIAVLGVLKAGGAYVPLDPAYPQQRLHYMLQHSGARVLLTQEALRTRFEDPAIECIPVDGLTDDTGANAPVPGPAGGDLAHVIYTSGSTGQPKGVAIPHHALTNFIDSMRSEPGLSKDDVLLAVTTLCFDIAGLELYLPLVAGGRVAVASREDASDGERLKTLLETSGATVMQATPATWRMLMEASWKGDRRLKVLCGGEAMPKALADQLLARAGSVWNMYGPTETTVWSSVYQVHAGERTVPVGKPIANTQFYIVDRERQPVPVGVPGELLIGGDGLAAGYLHDAERTAERFIENPFSDTPGERLYRTGDLARFLPDGNVELLGRMDNQVKVRGFRIELGEIEAVLTLHPEVRTAAVTVQEDPGREKMLVAYVCAARGANPAESELRALLNEKLPPYMIPSFIQFLERMPQTPNGKIDRKALAPVQRSARGAAVGAGTGSCDLTELRLLRIWTDVLGIRPSSAEQSFFELGGNSLAAARLLARIDQEFGNRLSMAAIFNAPTIAQQAAMLRADGEVRWPRVVTVQPEGTQSPFFFVGGGVNFLSPLGQQLRKLGLDRPFLTLAHPKIDDLPHPCQLKHLAACHVETLLQLQPQGPYVLGGFCAEGAVAYEMAQQLLAMGHEVAWLGMFETENRTDRRLARDTISLIVSILPTRARARALFHEGLFRWSRRRAELVWRMLLNCFRPRMVAVGGFNFLFDFSRLELYKPQPYPGKVQLYRRRMDASYLPDPKLGWGDLIEGLEVLEMPGSHLGMFAEPEVEILAERVAEGIRAADNKQAMAAGQA